MRRHQKELGILCLVTFLLLTTACGKKTASEEEVQDTDNPIGAPPAPPMQTTLPTPTYNPPPQAENTWSQPESDFNGFNQVLGRCRDSFGNKGKLLRFLIQLLQETDAGVILFAANSNDYESRGFKPGHSRAAACMGHMRNRMGRIRDWLYSGNFRNGVLQNWLGHTTDWAMNNVQYPSYWQGNLVPAGPMQTYQSGQTYYPQTAWTNHPQAGQVLGGGYFQPSN